MPSHEERCSICSANLETTIFHCATEQYLICRQCATDSEVCGQCGGHYETTTIELGHLISAHIMVVMGFLIWVATWILTDIFWIGLPFMLIGVLSGLWNWRRASGLRGNIVQSHRQSDDSMVPHSRSPNVDSVNWPSNADGQSANSKRILKIMLPMVGVLSVFGVLLGFFPEVGFFIAVLTTSAIVIPLVYSIYPLQKYTRQLIPDFVMVDSENIGFKFAAISWIIPWQKIESIEIYSKEGVLLEPSLKSSPEIRRLILTTRANQSLMLEFVSQAYKREIMEHYRKQMLKSSPENVQEE